MTKRQMLLCAIAIGSTMGLTEASIARTIYKIDSATTLLGKGSSWDYLTWDGSRNYLFLGRRKHGVTIFDAQAHRVVGTVENSEEANAATLVPEYDRGYTANEDGTTTVFQLSSLKTIDRLKIGPSADNAFFDPTTKQIIFTMGDDKLLTFVAAKTGHVDGTLKMNAEELEGAATDDAGHVFVAERDVDKIAEVDVAKRTLLAEYPTTGCDQPTGMAIDIKDARLLIGCKGTKPVLLVMDSKTGRVITTKTIGRGNDGVVYDAETRRVFATGGIDGNLVIFNQVDPDTYEFQQALTTRPIARTLTIDPKTKTIFTMMAEGMVDPTKPINHRAGDFYPNTFFDNTMTVLSIGPHEVATPRTTSKN